MICYICNAFHSGSHRRDLPSMEEIKRREGILLRLNKNSRRIRLFSGVISYFSQDFGGNSNFIESIVILHEFFHLSFRSVEISNLHKIEMCSSPLPASTTCIIEHFCNLVRIFDRAKVGFTAERRNTTSLQRIPSRMTFGMLVREDRDSEEYWSLHNHSYHPQGLSLYIAWIVAPQEAVAQATSILILNDYRWLV